MGFFSVLGDISRNKSNFKQWEQDERNKDAQRKALYQKGVGKERFDEAKKRGDVIIDVITQMDQHSENVAEDVEQGAHVASSLAIIPASILGGVLSAGLGIKGGTLRTKVIGNFKKTRNLSVIYDELRKTWREKSGGKGYLHLPNGEMSLLSSKSMAKYKKYLAPETQEQLIQYAKDWAKTAKPYKKYILGAAIAWPLVFIGTFVGSIIAGTKLQIEGSRVARWQARENLNAPKNYVIYTPEQIAKAKENLAKRPPEKTSITEKIFGKTEKNNTGFWTNWKNLIRDRAAYNKWKATDTQEKVETPLTDEQIKQAKLDQELIQRITKKINNKAEEYSENMETAAETVIGSSLIGGPLIGGAIGWIMEKTGLGEKLALRSLEKETSKEIADKVKQLSSEKLPDYKFAARAKELKKEIKEAITKKYIGEEKGAAFGFTDILNNFKAWKKGSKMSALVTKAGRIGHISKVTGVLTTLVGGFIALGWQKNAARAGRYIAREEFKNNPQEFMSYTDEEMQQVADVKGEKPTTGQKFKEWIGFIPTCIKQMHQYNKYKKGEYKEQQKLHEELVKLDVSEKQLQDAKNLKRKLNNTFEVLDDKSQVYSENMEAANEIAQPFIIYGSIGAFFLPLIAAGIGLATGKITTTKIADWTTGILAKFSSLTKSKLFKKHIAEMGNKANEIIDATEIGTKNFAKEMYEGIFYGYDKSKAAEIVKGTLGIDSSLLELIKKSYNLSKDEANYLAQRLKLGNDAIKESLGYYSISRNAIEEAITGQINQVINKSKKIAPVAEAILKPIKLTKIVKAASKTSDSINKFSDNPLFKEFLTGFNEAGGKDISSEQIQNFLKKFDLKSHLREFATNEQRIKAINEWMEFNQFGNIQNGKIDKKYVEKLLGRIEKIAGNFPAEEAENAIKSVLVHAMEEPEKFLTLMKYNPEALAKCYMTPILKKTMITLGISWGAFLTLMTYLMSSYFASMQKDAGRLGVMKSIEELQDYRYYADEIPEGNSPQKVEVTKVEKVQEQLKIQSKYPSTNYLSKKLG